MTSLDREPTFLISKKATGRAESIPNEIEQLNDWTTITKLLDFPISSERIENVSDILSEGDIIKVKLIGFDRGKMKLSKKALET